MTVTICIGNSDNRLTQQEWSKFIEFMEFEIDCVADIRHFGGGPATSANRQNYAWVVECSDEKLDKLRLAVIKTRKCFNQESAAFVVGKTEKL